MKKEEKDRLEEIYYCFRYSYSCKSCPKDWLCEKKLKEEREANLYAKHKTRKVYTEHSKRHEPKRSI